MAGGKVRIALIAAVAKNGVIGRDGGMPWRLSSDMKFFKATTMGKPIVMGRKQYETVGKPLPGRTNIVVTRQEGYRPEGVVVFSDLSAALDCARSVAARDGADEVMVIGGGEIYAATLPLADRLYLTEVDLEPEGDVRFPAVDFSQWRVVETPEVVRGEKDEADFVVRVWERA